MAEDIKHKTKKGIYWTFFNQLATNGLSFIVGIVMARLLTPSDYGITALPAIFIAIAGIIIQSGFGNALVRKPKVTEEDLSTALYYSIAMGVFCYLLLFVSAPFIADFYDTPVLKPLVRVTALTFLWTPVNTPQQVILKRRLDFKKPAYIAIISYVIGASIGIYFAYNGYGLWALVIMSVVQSFISFLLYWFAVRWIPTKRWSQESFRYLWGFGNKLMFSWVIDAVYSNLTPIIVGKYFSTYELGLYNRARNYAALPATQGTSVLQSVTFPVLSKFQDQNDVLALNYRRVLKVSAFVIFPVMTLLAALAKPLIVILVTDKWLDAVLLLQLLCFGMMWYPIAAINLNLLQVKGRSELFLKLEIWKKALGLTVMACTLPFGLVFFVAAGIVSSFISLFINTYYTGKLIGVGYIIQLRDFMPSYALSVLVFIVVYGMNQFIDNLWVQLILGGCIGVVLYLGLAYLFHFSEFQDVKYMLNRKK